MLEGCLGPCVWKSMATNVSLDKFGRGFKNNIISPLFIILSKYFRDDKFENRTNKVGVVGERKCVNRLDQQ